MAADSEPDRPMHTTIVRSDEVPALQFDLHARAYMKFMIDLRTSGLAKHLNGAEMRVLGVLLESLDMEKIAGGELLTHPIAKSWIAKCSGHWLGTVGRAIDELLLAGIAIVEAGGRGRVNEYRLRIPRQNFHKRIDSRRATEEEKVAQARRLKLCRHVRGSRAGTSSPDVPARHSISAPAQLSIFDTTDISGGGINTIYTPPPSAPDFEWTEELREVVVGRLRQWEIPERRVRGSKAASIEDLLSSGIGPLIALAAIDAAQQRPKDKQAGYAITRLRDPGLIPDASLRRAEAKLSSRRQVTLTSPGQSRGTTSSEPAMPPIDQDRIKRIAAELEAGRQ
jgi:hypothetical protein